MPTRRFNFRFALYLFLSVAVVCVSGYFVHGYQVNRNAGALLARADRAQELGEINRTAEYLERYLSLSPNDLAVQIRYGLLLSDRKIAKSPRDLYRAMLVLDQVLYREPDRHDLRRRSVRMALDLELFANAKNEINTYLLPVFPEDGEIEGMLGRCHEATGAFQEARTAYERSIKHAPDLIESYRRLARLLRRHTKEVLRKKETASEASKKADEVIDAMVRVNGSSSQALLLRAEYRRTFDPQNTASAAQDIARAQAIDPDAVDVLTAVAKQAGDTDDALKLLQHGCQIHPDDWRIFAARANLEINLGKKEQALATVREGLAQTPNQLDLLWQFTDLLIDTNRRAEFYEALARLERSGVAESDRDCFRARLLMTEKHWLDAARLLERAVPILAGRAGSAEDTLAARLAIQAGLLLGQCCTQIGDIDRAVSAFDRVIARDPRSVPARIGLAGALASLGRLSDSIEQYRQIQNMRLTGVPAGAVVEVARLLLLRHLEPGETQRDWTDVENVLDRAENTADLRAAALAVRVEMLIIRKLFDDARALLVKMYAEPTSRPVEAWIALATLEDKQGRGESALAILDDAAKHVSDVVDLRLARARILIQRDPSGSNATLVELSKKLDRFGSDDRRRLLKGLAALAVKCNDVAFARHLLGQLAEQQPDDLPCQFELFDLAARAGDKNAMQRQIDALKHIEGDDGIFWRLAAASFQIAQGESGDKYGLAEARSLLTAIAMRRARWSRFEQCEARLDELEGKPEAALNSYLRSIQFGDQDVRSWIRAIGLLSERNRYAEAYDLIKRLALPETMPQQLRRIGAELAIQCRDGANALKLAQGAVANDSKDFRDYLWLGRIHLAAGKPVSAGPLFERARDLAPGDPDAWVALVQFLFANGEKPRAQAECAEATKRLTGAAGQLGLARCYEAIGESDRAKEFYEAALAANSGDPTVVQGVANFFVRTGQFRAAESLLRRLSNEMKTRSPTIAQWAHRTLAIVLAIQGDAARTNEALALLGADGGKSSSAKPDINDQRARATVLAVRPALQTRRRAVQILESLIANRVATPEDYFLAAQLHEAIGDWPRGRQRYLDLIRLFGMESSAHVIGCARSLLRHGETDEARPLVQRIVASDPKSFLACEFKARWLHAEGKLLEAVGQIEAYAQTDGANLIAAADLLSQLDAHAAAERLFRRNAEKSAKPADEMVFAHYLFNRRQYAESLEICERVWSEVPALTVAELAIAILAEAPSDRRINERIDTRIMQSLQQSPDVAGLIAALAAVRNFQGRYDDAEQLYRKALAKDAKLLVALNNLAWLLALRNGNAAEGLELLRRAAEVGGVDAALLDTRGVVYLSLRNGDAIAQAIKDLESAAVDQPSAATCFHLAQAYFAAGRRKEAAQVWRRGTTIGLNANVLHPLERPAFERLSHEISAMK